MVKTSGGLILMTLRKGPSVLMRMPRTAAVLCRGNFFAPDGLADLRPGDLRDFTLEATDGLVLEFEDLFFLRGIGNLQNEFAAGLIADVEILVPFAGQLFQAAFQTIQVPGEAPGFFLRKPRSGR